MMSRLAQSSWGWPVAANRERFFEAAAKSGMVAANAIRVAKERSVEVAPGWEYWIEQAVRMTRMAVYHAFKARPDLKPPDAYDRAVKGARR